jgi:hypothetical protein
MKKTRFSLSAFALGAALTAQAQINTSAFVSASDLASALLNPSAGITINSASYIGVDDASGFFTSSGVLPFSNGIVLTTGSRSSVEGLNTAANTSVENLAAGDADLDALGGAPSFDAAVLEIRFTPTNNVISFQYAFGSEEYNEWVSGVNDVFGFFLNGTNIAVLPSTTTDVSINSVNNGANPEFYFDNELSVLATQLDGFGGINANYYLHAIGAVNAGVENVLRIAIGDILDGALDSAVFIAGGSLIDSTPVPEPSTYALGGTLALAGLIAIRRRTRATSRA